MFILLRPFLSAEPPKQQTYTDKDVDIVFVNINQHFLKIYIFIVFV